MRHNGNPERLAGHNSVVASRALRTPVSYSTLPEDLTTTRTLGIRIVPVVVNALDPILKVP